MSIKTPKIIFDEVSNVRTSYIDVSSEIELGENSPKMLKMACIPIDLRCFMPIAWDAVSSENQKSFLELLNIPAHTGSVEEIIGDRKEYQQNNYIIGGDTNIPDYEECLSPILRLLPDIVTQPRNPAALSTNNNAKLHPLKLLYLFFGIDNERISVADRDLFDLIFDKVALAALLPYILSTTCWPNEEQANSILNNDQELDISKALDAHLIKALEKTDFLSFPTHTTLTTASGIEIVFPAEFWNGLARYATNSIEDPYYMAISIEDLDDILSRHLSALFKQRLSNEVHGESLWKELKKYFRVNKNYRRTDHGYFYEIIDHFFENRKRPLSYGKIPFLDTVNVPPLPYVEFIDLKPQYWESDAIKLSTELEIASNRYEKARQAFLETQQSDLEKLNAAQDELRKASTLWQKAKTDFSELSSELEKEGYELKAMSPSEEELYNVGKAYRVTRKHLVSYNVTLKRSETRTRQRTEYLRIKKCRKKKYKVAGFTYKTKKRCFTELKPRLHKESYTHTWYVVEKKIKEVDKIATVNVRQLEDYLEKEVSSEAFSTPHYAREFARSLNKPIDDATALPATLPGILNKMKRTHLFSLRSDEYIDQDGRKLESILEELDKGTMEDINRVLLLIPKMLPTSKGLPRVEGYYAVHIPSVGRGNLQQPRIYLQETYALTFGRSPGHWIGKLSHVESLFPGENRSLKLVAETSESVVQLMESSQSDKFSSSNSSELEKRITDSLEKQKESSKTKKWNAKTSGGVDFGVWDAGGSGGISEESTKNTKDISKKVNQTIENVVSSYSQDKEVVFKSSFNRTAGVSNTREETREFRNVNEGRSVNYKFFQVMHRYDAQTELRDMRVIVEYSDELIPGLDIRQLESYSLDRIQQLLPNLIEEERHAIINHVYNAISLRHASREVNYSNGERTNVSFLEFDENDVPTRVNDNAILDKQHWYTNSGSFFVETEVSSQPATEQYIEDARCAEIDIQNAQKRRIDAEANAIESGKIFIPNDTNTLTINMHTGSSNVSDDAQISGDP